MKSLLRAVALMLVSGSPALADTVVPSYQYREFVNYSLRYFVAPTTLWLRERGTPNHLEATMSPDEGGHHVAFELSFSLEGIRSRDFSGATVSSSPFDANGSHGAVDGDAVRFFNATFNGRVSDYSEGTLTFGRDGSVTDWQYLVGQSSGGTATIAVSSASRELNSSTIAPSVSGAELVDGQVVYDSYYWEPYDLAFTSRRGFWEVSVSTSCGLYDEDYHSPNDGPCSSGPPVDTPATVPLPSTASLTLIPLMVLFGVGRAAQNRRRRNFVTS